MMYDERRGMIRTPCTGKGFASATETATKTDLNQPSREIVRGGLNLQIAKRAMRRPEGCMSRVRIELGKTEVKRNWWGVSCNYWPYIQHWRARNSQ